MKFPALSVVLALSSSTSVSAFGVPRSQVSFSRCTALNAADYDFSVAAPAEKKSKKKAAKPEPVPVPDPTPAPVEAAKPTRKSKKAAKVEEPKVVEAPKVEEPKAKSTRKTKEPKAKAVQTSTPIEQKVLETKPEPKSKKAQSRPQPKAQPVPVAKSTASSQKDPNAVTTGVALGAAPLVAVPFVALGALRSTLTNTKARREEIAKEIAEFEAAEAKKKAKKNADVDGGTLGKAVVSFIQV